MEEFPVEIFHNFFHKTFFNLLKWVKSIYSTVSRSKLFATILSFFNQNLCHQLDPKVQKFKLHSNFNENLCNHHYTWFYVNTTISTQKDVSLIKPATPHELGPILIGSPTFQTSESNPFFPIFLLVSKFNNRQSSLHLPTVLSLPPAAPILIAIITTISTTSATQWPLWFIVPSNEGLLVAMPLNPFDPTSDLYMMVHQTMK